ncbi:MAG: DUF6285 domain-containing protein [Proteobacteria bacterium]|nr:DUF6285 domain-containing protein [Pseudomonadota bacterium]
MQDRPDAKNLLEAARRVLLDSLLPDLPEARLYDVLMVARCMEIGARALAAGEAPLRREYASLTALTEETGVEEARTTIGPQRDRTDLEQAIEARNRALCQAIRAGEFDGVRAATLGEHLWQTVTDKVCETNPKYVKTLV